MSSGVYEKQPQEKSAVHENGYSYAPGYTPGYAPDDTATPGGYPNVMPPDAVDAPPVDPNIDAPPPRDDHYVR